MSAQLATIRLDFPEKLQVLFEPSRYKILYGGRGGAKSWGAVRALLTLGMRTKLRIPCCREIQDSIDQSVYKLICDQIERMGISQFYRIHRDRIIGLNGTEFTFHGLKHNIDNIKSLEGADIVLVEEADNVGAESWKKLIPTVRKEGSEIWVLFNPQLETDETYRRFVMNPPPGAVVVKINWSDNPWFPEVLRQEMEHQRAVDYDDYLNIWEGHCRHTLTGAIYAKELREATEQSRIIKVPYERTAGVDVFCDLGIRDWCSLWFVQRVAMQKRVLKSYQNRHQAWTHYLDYIQDSGYLIRRIWLPHDGKARQLGTGKSIEEITREAGRPVSIVPQLSIVDGINAVRETFQNCWFDEEGCSEGLQALRHYCYEKDSRGQYTKMPLHDDNSNYADAFRYLSVGYREVPKSEEREAQASNVRRKLATRQTLELGQPSSGWMG